MNFTLISLGLAAVQPLIQAYFANLVKRKMQRDASLAFFILIHDLPGRRRYQSIILKDEIFANELRKKLLDLDVAKSITVNSVTGTILFTFDVENTNTIDAVINHLNEQNAIATDKKLADFDASNQSIFSKITNSIRAKNPRTPAKRNLTVDASSKNNMPTVVTNTNGSGRSGAHLTILAQAIKDYVVGINGVVRSLLRNALDLTMILGGAFLAIGAYKVFITKQMPSGPQLMWWGYKFVEKGVNK